MGRRAVSADRLRSKVLRSPRHRTRPLSLATVASRVPPLFVPPTVSRPSSAKSRKQRRTCALLESVVPMGLIARPVELTPDLSHVRTAARAGEDEGNHAVRTVVGGADLVKPLVGA